MLEATPTCVLEHEWLGARGQKSNNVLGWEDKDIIEEEKKANRGRKTGWRGMYWRQIDCKNLLLL